MIEKKKCPLCSEKIHLYGFECRCGLSFCSKHRYPENHNCSFNFKEYDKKKLKESLEGCEKMKKIEKI